MKQTACLISLGLLFAITGCVGSLHPLYTKKDLIFDPALVGTWNDKDSKNPCTFTEAGDKAYTLLCANEGILGVNKSNKKDEFTVHLLKLNNQRYLDMLPLKLDSQELKMLKHLHFINKVQLLDNTLQLSSLNLEWLKKLLKANPDALRNSQVKDDSVFLRASTTQLQAFVIKHANTRGAWDKGDLLTRQSERAK